jgi:gliding motility-associated-like protein
VIIFSVEKPTTPSVTLNIANQSICQGTTEVATAKSANAGTNSLFKWYVNNVEQTKIKGSTFPLANIANADGLSVKAVSDQCYVRSESTETPSYIFTVTSVVSASINIYASKTPFCSGDVPTLYTSSMYNQGGNPVFQWRVNGVNVVNPDGNANNLTLSTLRNGDKVDVLMTSDQACLVSKTVYSNFVNINIHNTALVPSVQIFANNNLCPNNSASFTATTNNVGIDEMTSYKWMVNGVLNTNSSFNNSVSLSNLKNNDVVICQVEGAYNLCNTTTNPNVLSLTSNAIKMNVSPVICNGFLIKPQLQILGAKNVNVGESQNFYASQVQADTVKLAGVPIKFNWYYKLVDPTGLVSFQRAYILDNNPKSQTVIQNNVSVTFPNNVQKLYAIASYYSSVESDYVAFDTLSHDIVLNNIKSTTKPSCSDTLGCSDYIITNVKIASVENDQLANNTECPYSSHGYSDFSTAEFVYYEIDSVIKTQVNQFASVYSSSSFAMQIKGLNQAQYYGVWVDINQDGDFEDAKEFLIASTEPAVVYNTSVVIPSIEGSEGERRLRIRSSNNPLTAKDYCGFSNVSKGETEDYLIIIQAYPELKAPQVFTPGVDGYNDYFVVLGIDEAAGNTELQVFDKLGNIVYSNTEYDNKWGGEHNNGSKLLNGTYYYRVKNGTREIKGFVELVNEVASAE